MKCIFDDNKIIIFLENYDKNYLNDMDYLEDNFRDIFLKLKKKYKIKIHGFCNVDAYIDNNDMVLEIEQEIVDYYDDIVDMKITIHENKFLYEIINILDIKKYIKGDIYLYKNKFYIDKQDINLNILEHAKLIYKDTQNINKKWRY